jgi:hypothetical protein
MTEFTTDGTNPTFKIAGHELNESLTDSQRADIANVLDSPEAAPAAVLLRAMLKIGMDPTSEDMALLAANAVAYENGVLQGGGDGDCHPCVDPGTGCMGCCGLGCSGCSGICTDDCESHDNCVRDNGHTNLTCLIMLIFAADSAQQCALTNCAGGGCNCCCSGTCDCNCSE